MNEETKYALIKLKNAFLKLKEGGKKATEELEIDGVIQRFEFTFELFWKTLKIFLRNKGIEARTPRDVFKESFRIEWLNDEAVFLDMLEDRNKTSHIYDQKESREIFSRIKNNHIPAIEMVLKALKNMA